MNRVRGQDVKAAFTPLPIVLPKDLTSDREYEEEEEFDPYLIATKDETQANLLKLTFENILEGPNGCSFFDSLDTIDIIEGLDWIIQLTEEGVDLTDVEIKSRIDYASKEDGEYVEGATFFWDMERMNPYYEERDNRVQNEELELEGMPRPNGKLCREPSCRNPLMNVTLVQDRRADEGQSQYANCAGCNRREQL